MHFSLNPALDAAALAARFVADGRIRIAGLLAGDGAEQLHGALRARIDWRQMIHREGGQVAELDRAARAALAPAQAAALDGAVYAQARYGFQYRYEAIRVPDDAAERAASGDPLAALARFLSEGAGRDFLRAVTGDDGIDFADAQGTAYAPGDFLTGHDDAVAGKHRVAAYVLGLTPTWRAEWGGLLLFHRDDGTIEGRVPGFNTLDLFGVPQLHSVSEVSRAAAYRRYAVTGWLRRRG